MRVIGLLDVRRSSPTAAFNGAAGADLASCADRPLALPPNLVTQGNVQVN